MLRSITSDNLDRQRRDGAVFPRNTLLRWDTLYPVCSRIRDRLIILGDSFSDFPDLPDRIINSNFFSLLIASSSPDSKLDCITRCALCARPLDAPGISWYDSHMDDRARLREVERELDDTSPSGPYRVTRQKLNRERNRILSRLNGRDPRYFATNKKEGGVPTDKRGLFRIKNVIVTILEELEGGKHAER